MAGIYIHIPFCKQACSYCDFYFVTRRQLIEPFVNRLVSEIRSHKDTLYSAEPISTIYMGGGTPSLLSASQLSQIFQALHETFRIIGEEITIEMNPDDVTAGYLNSLKDIGVTRASMGIQSFQEELLHFMHRAHSRDEALKALELLHRTGFDSFTADLIYGNPGQSEQMLRKDIDTLLQFDPPHISAYSLTVEPKTRLGKQVELGRIDPPEDETVAAHFDIVKGVLSNNGIRQYEVSNFARVGKEAVHNSNYWNHHNYLGMGPAAHSFWWNRNEAVRWENVSNIKSYLDGKLDWNTLRTEKSVLQLPDLAEERLMLGLRTVAGVAFSELKTRYQAPLNPSQVEWIEYQVNAGMIEPSTEYLKLTPEGLKIADLLTVDLLSKGQ
jgi:oxygen-independent coproporphyrinogen III oxidase